MFAYGLSHGLFRLGSFARKLSFLNDRFGFVAQELSLGIVHFRSVRLGSLAREFPQDPPRLDFAGGWELSSRSSGSAIFPWNNLIVDLPLKTSFGELRWENVRLGFSVWEHSFSHFRLRTLARRYHAWKTGLRSLGKLPIVTHEGEPANTVLKEMEGQYFYVGTMAILAGENKWYVFQQFSNTLGEKRHGTHLLTNNKLTDVRSSVTMRRETKGTHLFTHGRSSELKTQSLLWKIGFQVFTGCADGLAPYHIKLLHKYKDMPSDIQKTLQNETHHDKPVNIP